MHTQTFCFLSSLDVNYFGTVHTLKAALPAMIEADNHGHLVLVSSAASLAAFVGYTQYNTHIHTYIHNIAMNFVCH